jgi:AraC-like DNA-binding protein
MAALAEPIFDATIAPAAPQLRPYIENYVGYRMEGFSAGVHRGLPGRHLIFIISLGDPVELIDHPGSPFGPASYQAFASGFHAGPAMIAHDGNQFGVSLDLTPLGARAVLGLPASELASQVVDLDDLMGRPAVELVDRVVAAESWPERFAVLDEVLTRVVTEPKTPPTEVGWAWQQLLATRGATSVSELADEVGWSRRHLSERFRQETGLTPKVAGRVFRFDRSKALLRQPDPPSLAEVAARCGYYDQPHLNRDWHEMAGCTPLTWLAEEEFPSVQDDDESVGGD